MPLTKLQFRPGINRETTSYSNEGGWFDMDKTRFRFGFPEKIGGWIKQSVNAYLGTARSLHPLPFVLAMFPHQNAAPQHEQKS